ncbi:MAG: peptide deformylase [Weeksellaceae bacterium]
MILPIRAYGDPVLRKKAKDITQDYPNLDILIANMFQTMEHAFGIGLAAPQIGLDIRLFLINLSPLAEDEEYEDIKDELLTFKKVFINAKITKKINDEWKFNEGCLSIPGVREDISRPETIDIEYYDENWNFHKDTFSDVRARVIQHEYDHIEGILFTDYLTPLKKRLIQNKLKNITKGKVKTDYQMQFPNPK